MHRHVRRVGDQRAVAVEHRAGEVEPLLDVDRIGGVLQRHAHLLGDRHEQIVEHFEHHRIGAGCRWRGARASFSRPPQHQMILRGELGPPAVLDDDRLVRLDDDGGAGHLVAGRERVARVDERARAICRRRRSACGAPARGSGARVVLCTRSRKRGAAADRLDRDRLDDQRLAAIDEAEARLVRALEGGFHFLQRHWLHLPLGEVARERGGVGAMTSLVRIPRRARHRDAPTLPRRGG